MTRGCRIVRGYVQVRIIHKGRYYHKNFGLDSPLARELAQIHLAEKRKEILMGRFGVTQELPVKSFAEAARLYFERWSNEKDAEGKIAHRASGEAGRVITTNLVPYFGKRSYEDIRPVDVIGWRQHRLKAVLGTSVNREQAVLSSIFSHIERWVKTEAIPAFKIPVENPCKSVEKAPNRKRKRVLSILELKALKEACNALGDLDMWEICSMALKSLLRKKDLFNLESSVGIDTVQFKTQRQISLPVHVDKPLNYFNFRKRWEAARRAARLEFPKSDPRNTEFRDLRRTGANLLKMRGHSMKLMSEFLGHSTQKTTEIYMTKDAEHLKPLAKDLEDILSGL